MTYEVKMPQLTETMEAGTIIEWKKATGEYVEKGEKLVEVETDKMTFEVEALDSGYLCEIFHEGDSEVPVGELIAKLADSMDEC
ncbi:MAG: hypothetical protein K9L68_00230 [Spirochaetales bacterium]|nr:hypothetical protein [Spirochaetales bacterium]MCF7937004.1 hypothetical protein [Spirochaetales bacterium]